jgi:uncharacterized membrane protein YraQ (UPF0718 family)
MCLRDMYFGLMMAAFIGLTFFVAMVCAAYVVEVLFGALGLVPGARTAAVMEASVSLNYTTVLNVVFLALAAILVIRFLRTGGRKMLSMMDGRADEMHMGMEMGAL